jgi:putative oxidoreductase
MTMKWADILHTEASGWTVLVRLSVGLVVFLPEGIQKLIFPDILGAGRFARIGIPLPDVTGPFVGVVETVCGLLIIIGLFTRLAAIPLIIIMIVARSQPSFRSCLGMTSGFFTWPATSNAPASGA